jgi:type I restriction enzyme M protein
MFEQTFKNIDDILYKDAGADSELDYIEQTSWVLFLRYLDQLESEKADEAALEGKEYQYILDEQFVGLIGQCLKQQMENLTTTKP